ncbi:protein FAR1-RELATED SEQUENCE 5-like [Juglans microcarpa x Juglans regia]|uniref:protein FAR1-RELATED SEQUENCE 5-like n=1 Tax=Juglans microcarpa x Juglans regia TaxID=2249226 RepID=UPI001B7EC8FA|nr:protein FAR1-RELATED SEQUENCE 5-like [Juglans microcarpa x Juglans regia]
MVADMLHSDNECNEVRIDIDIECDETIEEPTVEMKFLNVEEVRSYYLKYGKQKRFGVCKMNSRQDDNGNIRWLCLACAQGGSSKSKAVNVMKPRQIEKMGFMARINAILNYEGGYILSKVTLDHTHVCSPRKARHFRYFKKVDARVAKRLEINDEVGIKLSKNFKVVVVEVWDNENVLFGEKECRNYIDKARQLRLGVGVVAALYARSRAAYESFEDMITFDTTYLTNAYKVPFALFVGLNHHWQSILFRHRFCLWHIMKMHLEKFGSHYRYEEIKSTLRKCVYDSFSEHEFKERISITQQSEGMNAFFNDYVNSRITLKQFVDQYDSTLGRKGGKTTFVVANEVQVGDDLLKRAIFTVKVDQDPLDVKYSCKLFEFRGILCSYDTNSIDDARMYDRIPNCFYKLCSNVSKAESSCVKLISQIKQLKVQYLGIADPATSMGDTTVDLAISMWEQ